MRLFRLELKRILKSRRTFALLVAAMVFSAAMAYLPAAFEGINRPNEDGTVTELDGPAAIRYKRGLYAATDGEVTPEKVREALKVYQDCIRKYGPVEGEDFPFDVSIKKIIPVRPLLRGLSEAFADPLTGAGADWMDIDPDEIDLSYYEKCAGHLADVMRNEQRNYPLAQQQASGKYAQVHKPFKLYAGMSRDAFDYTELYILLLAVLCVAIAAPLFAGEYQTGADGIMRATKHGRARLAVTKILASCTIFVAVFIFGMAMHLLIVDMAFGPDCLKSSLQMLYSIISLPDKNLGQLQAILAVAGLLSVLATASYTLFLSAKCKDPLTVLLVSVVTLLAPSFAYAALGANWISSILPSAGIGMQNNFLYQYVGFYYLHVGEMSFWTPYAILISAAVEIPVFLILAVKAYCGHQAA